MPWTMIRVDLAAARERLVEELREHALVIGAVTLTSGAQAEYYVDAKRAILRPRRLRGARDAARGTGRRVGRRRRSAA